jgi:hypothetical protein
MAFEKPPAVAFEGSANAARVMDKAVPLSVLFVLFCTTAPEPLVPEVSTFPNWWMLHRQPVWVTPPKAMVTAPAVGAAPIALNRVVRYRGVAMVPQVTVFTWTHVSPLPVSVGVSGGLVLFELVTQARIRVFAVGVMLDVVHEEASVPLALPVNRVWVTAAVAVPGRRTNDQAAIKAPTKERRSAAFLGLPVIALIPSSTRTSTSAVRRKRLHLSRGSIVRGVSTDRAISWTTRKRMGFRGL